MITVVFGPTGVGKTQSLLELAKKEEIHLVNMDSMQIYKEMNIGTAKPTASQRRAAAHHLFDMVTPDQSFTVYDYRKKALGLIQELKEKKVYFVGGTGLYLSSLYYDFSFRRKRTTQVYSQTTAELYEKLLQTYPHLEGKVDPYHRHQVIGALESGTVLGKEKRVRSLLPLKILFLNRDRKELYERIDRRVVEMVEEGLVDEVKYLIKKYSLTRNHQSMKAIGYREIYSYLQGELSLEEAIEKIQQSSRNYAKRQITWVRHQYGNDYLEVLAEEVEKVL